MKENRDNWKQLVTDNINLVYSTVHKMGVPKDRIEDVFSEGKLALIECARRFDPDKGFQFSTYAIPWIQGRCKRFLRENKEMKFSRTLIDRAVLVNKYCNENGIPFESINGKVIEEAGVDSKDANAVMDFFSMQRLENTISDGSNRAEIADVVADNRETGYEWCESIEDSMMEIADDFFDYYRKKYTNSSRERGCCIFEDIVYNAVCGVKVTQQELAKKYGICQAHIARQIKPVKEEFKLWMIERMAQ